MSGTNKFKRAVQDHRLGKNLIDARNERNFDTFPEDLKEETVIVNGRQYTRPLPTDQQRYTDPIQLKARPIYKLVRDNGRCTCGECN